jgi:hypothetical protein
LPTEALISFSSTISRSFFASSFSRTSSYAPAEAEYPHRSFGLSVLELQAGLHAFDLDAELLHQHRCLLETLHAFRVLLQLGLELGLFPTKQRLEILQQLSEGHRRNVHPSSSALVLIADF